MICFTRHPRSLRARSPTAMTETDRTDATDRADRRSDPVAVGRARWPVHGLMLAALAACSAAPRPVLAGDVPPEAGQSLPAQSCRPEAAWDMAGNRVAPPEPLRCLFPWYPRSMRTANEQGELRGRIAVDSAGVPQLATLQVQLVTNHALVDAVRSALAYVRYAPIRPGESRPVYIHLEYKFTLTR